MCPGHCLRLVAQVFHSSSACSFVSSWGKDKNGQSIFTCVLLGCFPALWEHVLWSLLVFGGVLQVWIMKALLGVLCFPWTQHAPFSCPLVWFRFGLSFAVSMFRFWLLMTLCVCLRWPSGFSMFFLVQTSESRRGCMSNACFPRAFQLLPVRCRRNRHRHEAEWALGYRGPPAGCKDYQVEMSCECGKGAICWMLYLECRKIRMTRGWRSPVTLVSAVLAPWRRQCGARKTDLHAAILQTITFLVVLMCRLWHLWSRTCRWNHDTCTGPAATFYIELPLHTRLALNSLLRLLDSKVWVLVFWTV